MITWSKRHEGLPARSSGRPVALLLLLLVVGINAVGGGIGLMINGLGMKRAQLDGSPFESFLVPGIVLAVVVGGATLGAFWLEWTRHRHAAVSSMVAGGIVIGWILVQMAMLGYISLLQPIILTLGVAIALLALGQARPHGGRSSAR